MMFLNSNAVRPNSLALQYSFCFEQLINVLQPCIYHKFVCPRVASSNRFVFDRTTTYKANSGPLLHIGTGKWYT
jgi:hypothetical protein